MAHTSLENIRAAVRRIMGQPSTADVPTDDELDGFISSAVVRVFGVIDPQYCGEYHKTVSIDIDNSAGGVPLDVDGWSGFYSNYTKDSVRITKVSISKSLIYDSNSDATTYYPARRIEKAIADELKAGLYTFYSKLEPVWWTEGDEIYWRPVCNDGYLDSGLVGHIHVELISEPDYSSLDSSSTHLEEKLNERVLSPIEYIAASAALKALGLTGPGEDNLNEAMNMLKLMA